MLFKKKVLVEDYCTSTLTPVFAKEREATWEALRRSCNDSRLNAVDAQLYYSHLRAVFIQLMLIAITKNCSMDVSSDAHVFVMMYLRERDLSSIDAITKEYSHAFASSSTDGVLQMLMHFADALTGSTIGEATTERLYAEFYAILGAFLEDFKSIRLVTSR